MFRAYALLRSQAKMRPSLYLQGFRGYRVLGISGLGFRVLGFRF